MSMRATHRGAPLPYTTLAGVVPSPRGWLAVTGKLQGITLSAEEPQLFPGFLDVMDYKPAYQVIAVFIPIGLLDDPVAGGRSCDREARRLLGWPRAGAIASAPVRKALACSTYEEAAAANGGFLSPVTWRQRRRMAEIDRDIGPYWQRTVFEVHPELSFYQLNGDRPMSFSKHTQAGKEEREQVLLTRFPGVERIVNATIPGISRVRLLDAAACLWTARRIMSRAVARLPEDPEWDTTGLRMEFVR